jgi:hypothetical protein
MTDRNGILHENVAVLKEGQVFSSFISDYATGKGIFMRSLGAFDTGHVEGLSEFILKNADAVWASRGDGDQFSFNWNPSIGNHEPATGMKAELDPLIFQTAGLDALDAALRIAPGDRQMLPIA